IVISKYDHILKPIEGIDCYEAGHPILDENGIRASEKVLELLSDLNEDDGVLFLLSGGASALFEVPLIGLEELQDINRQLLASGANIIEINTIRKRLSKVKGGRFGKLCAPAKVYAVVLSDILGDPLDMIGSGPAYPDSSTCKDALKIVEKYQLKISEKSLALLKEETPKILDNVETIITGSVKELTRAAMVQAKKLGYEPVLISEEIDGIAREEGKKFAGLAVQYLHKKQQPIALIQGGETIVKLTGKGLGGRNQEFALAAAEEIAGLPIAVFSVGSDGTDGPTDAAGAYVDGNTLSKLKEEKIDPDLVLQNNDSYHALKQIDALIITGPTGTNVNDLNVALIQPSK
ncbi:MAG: DUF4147 domain-containing protein, partial [Erysipelotrichaceae bacterium]|nr:DUF4147 domain-containing protein [Erysipelotrichaceae bacterium]